ncbi:flagellar basal-body rod modification protein FlgD [Pelomonas saccharophila]|uniref:Basal-body rod modification protein FlgD n=1 Tax=Roseateles saccharophilus TaxID=304 RepID=A0ABU1YJK7_ROSSA|nr:flagellar hook capping FlgD N-terminal domain-containing protein [Roseateles saccharophilus]MDR7268211.1 flagellar basal-body rod modification protein FlgD [Roseateles saccharophilus]
MATSTDAVTQIGIQDFLKILVAQLGNQDPLKPMDNTEFVTQLAQFTSLQQTQEMNDKLGSLLTAQASMQSVGLLGKTVDVRTETGATANGRVTALSFTSGSPRLTVDAGNGRFVTDISLAEVTAVK